jgi:hypothetical protein
MGLTDQEILTKVGKMLYEINQSDQKCLYSIGTALYWVVKNIDKVNEIITKKTGEKHEG